MAEADLKVLDPIWTTAYITRNPFRKNVQDVPKFVAPVFWNVKTSR